MSLYFASARWGEGSGIYNYHARTDEILRTMLHRQQVAGRTSIGQRTVSPAFSKTQHMVAFLAEPSGASFTNPSYICLAFINCGLGGDHPKTDPSG